MRNYERLDSGPGAQIFPRPVGCNVPKQTRNGRVRKQDSSQTWGTSPPKCRTQGPEKQLRQPSSPRTCPVSSQDYISQQPPRSAQSLPRGLCLHRRPAGGAAATPLPPRRNLRGPGAAGFLFVRRGDMAAAPAAAGSGAGRGRRAAATVAAWGGWGGRPRPVNILLQLRQGQLTGRGLVRAVQVRSRPGGAGRGGPGGSWRGAGAEAFPAAAGRARPPVAGRGVCPWVARTLSAAAGGGHRPSAGPRFGAERGWAASCTDGVCEPGACARSLPSLRHVRTSGGLRASLLQCLRASSLCLVPSAGRPVVISAPERFLSLSLCHSLREAFP